MYYKAIISQDLQNDYKNLLLLFTFINKKIRSDLIIKNKYKKF